MPAANRQSSIGVTIKVGESITLDNVSDIPDLGATPEQIDVTAIGDDTRKYIDGIKDPGELEFTCFYEKEMYKKLNELVGEQNIVVTFKDSSTITIKGTVSVAIAWFGVGDAVTFTLKVAVSEIKWAEGAGA